MLPDKAWWGEKKQAEDAARAELQREKDQAERARADERDRREQEEEHVSSETVAPETTNPLHNAEQPGCYDEVTAKMKAREAGRRRVEE